MALITEERLRNRARVEVRNKYGSYVDPQSYLARSKIILSSTINEQKAFSSQNKEYDIFLSHSSSDAELVSGLKLEIEDLGFSVYIDWIEDPLLNRANVTKETALLLQQRMKQCKSLIYAFSENASNSKWMPWELGYFDALKQKVAVLPISRSTKYSYQGTEYLGIYYYVQIDTINGTNSLTLWVHETSNKYVTYNGWLGGTEPIQR